MIDVATFEALCLACSGTVAVPHVDRVAFRTTKRIFATLAPDRATANLYLAPVQQEILCAAAPASFHPVPGGWGRQGWTTMRFDVVDAGLARTAVSGAHAFALPPSVAAKAVQTGVKKKKTPTVASSRKQPKKK